MIDIDADAPENADVKPELEPGELIDVFLVPFAGLHKSLMVRSNLQRPQVCFARKLPEHYARHSSSMQLQDCCL